MSEYMIIDWFWRDVGHLYLAVASIIITVISACLIKYYCGKNSDEFTIFMVLSIIGFYPLIISLLLLAPFLIVGCIFLLLFAFALSFITSLVPEKNNPS